MQKAAPRLHDTKWDVLPEHFTFLDDGCEVAPHCLECPLERCRYDVHGGARRLRAETRDAEIRQQHKEGANIKALTQKFALSRYSIYRILSKADD